MGSARVREWVALGIALLVPCLARGEVPTPADSPPPDLTALSLDQLANLEVTSVSKRPEKQLATPAAIYVITQDDIRRSGATTLPEVLRLAPGVEVARIDSDHWAVGIRGFGSQFSQSLLVLIDGRSVYTPLLAGVIWGVQDTPLGDIERIEVIRGPGGTIWGANAVNGVINIITKPASETHGVQASGVVGSVERAAGDVRFGSGNGQGFDYRVYGKAYTRDGEFHPDGGDFDGWHAGQGGFRTDFKKGADSFTVQGDAYTSSEGERLLIATFEPPASVTVNQPLVGSGGNLRALWHRDLPGHGDLQFQAYYDHTHLTGPNVEETRNTVDGDFTCRWSLPGHETAVAGLGLRVSPSHVVQTTPSVDFDPRDVSNNLYSAFVQDEVSLAGDALTLTVGSKFEHNNYTGWELQPGARIAYLLSPHATVWGAVTRAVRPPSEFEEGLRDTGFLSASPLAFGEIDGSSTLQSERLVAYEAGYRAILGSKLSVDVAAFHDAYDDLVDFGAVSFTADATPAPPHLTLHIPYTNGLKGSADGFEVEPDCRPASWLQLKGSYSFLSLALKTLPGLTDVGNVVRSDEGSSPRHVVTVSAFARLPGGIEVDPRFRYVSALPAQTVKAYATADLRVAYWPTRTLEVALVGQNLLQPSHAEFAGDPGPIVLIRRSVYAQVTYRR